MWYFFLNIIMAIRNLGRLSEKTSTLLLCDMQEKFRPSIVYFPQIIEVARRMKEFAKILSIPTIVTEQYPKGLGPTVSELGDLSHAKKYEKTCFSMILPEVEQELKNIDRKSVILCGIETQACILKTTTDLLERDFDVHVVADGVSSRSQVDRLFALATMRQMGAFITTSETVLLQMMGDSKHPKFKEAVKLIGTTAPDSGLLQGFSATQE
uniref:Isochorismatase domain-containing protein 2, mitochondrial-like n=1 Tax=Phallusia mammillata TaxID=59560 RepID=A0A6F9DEP1_9ASCI|nr:isochorismatase domain-containing protein 2, mitochondrial-like [Phallusia mammillata]